MLGAVGRRSFFASSGRDDPVVELEARAAAFTLAYLECRRRFLAYVKAARVSERSEENVAPFGLHLQCWGSIVAPELYAEKRPAISPLGPGSGRRSRSSTRRGNYWTMKWTFEPGHSAAEFRARHMMVTWVRGSFKNVEGTLEFDPDDPRKLSVSTEIDATTCWTGVDARDEHLRSADFLHCEQFPKIGFTSTSVEEVGPTDYRVAGDLTIRGVTRPVTLSVHFLGTWETPWWEDGVDKGPKTRAGFVAKTQIDRYDFGVSWNDKMAGGGVVVSPRIEIVIDVEAILA